MISPDQLDILGRHRNGLHIVSSQPAPEPKLDAVIPGIEVEHFGRGEAGLIQLSRGLIKAEMRPTGPFKHTVDPGDSLVVVFPHTQLLFEEFDPREHREELGRDSGGGARVLMDGELVPSMREGRLVIKMRGGKVIPLEPGVAVRLQGANMDARHIKPVRQSSARTGAILRV